MSSTEQLTGPMTVQLNKAIEILKQVDADLWKAGEVGVRPEYLHYGIPEICSQAMAFSLLHSFCEEITRKRQLLALLHGRTIEEAMQKLVEEL